jgi:hypothetical protein
MKRGDPFERSRIDPNAAENFVAELLYNEARGREKAIPIASIGRLLVSAGFLRADARTVKKTVENLVVVHRCRIGARRSKPHGYFWIETAEDQAAAAAPYRAQILAMLRRLRVLDSAEDYRRFVGQLVIGE